MKLLTQYPLVGFALAIIGGILLIWRCARPKAKRPYDDVPSLRDPLPFPPDWSGDDSPALKVEMPVAELPLRDKHGRFVKNSLTESRKNASAKRRRKAKA